MPCAAGVPFGWFAGDEVYGSNGKLRTRLETAQIRYVLAVSCDHRVPAGAGRTIRADELAARLPRQAWQRLSAGKGAKGQRYYDWAWITVRHPGPGWRRLLIRRHPRTRELAFYRCYAPQPVTLAALVPSPGAGGPSRRTSRPVRAWPAWTSTRSAPGPPGTGGSPWPCSPPHSWPSPPQPNAGRPRPRRADPADPQRNRGASSPA